MTDYQLPKCTCGANLSRSCMVHLRRISDAHLIKLGHMDLADPERVNFVAERTIEVDPFNMPTTRGGQVLTIVHRNGDSTQEWMKFTCVACGRDVTSFFMWD